MENVFKRGGRTHDEKDAKRIRENEKPDLDPFRCIHSDCFDLIFQHLNPKLLLDCATVSQNWNQIIGESNFMMTRLAFNLKDESKNYLEYSVRPYQHFKVTQIHENQNGDFLSKIAKFAFSMKTLELQGKYSHCATRLFFDDITSMIAVETELSVSQLSELSFIGDVDGMSFILSNFNSTKKYKKLQLVGLSEEKFAEIIKNIQTEHLIINNMKLKNIIGHQLEGHPIVKTLELVKSSITDHIMNILIERIVALKKIHVDDLEPFSKETISRIEDINWRVRESSTQDKTDWVIHIAEELHNLVFQHLEEDDILAFSEVSKTWNRFSNNLIGSEFYFETENTPRATRTYRNIKSSIGPKLATITKIIPFVPHLRGLYIEIKPNSIKNVEFLFNVQPLSQLSSLNLACNQISCLDDLKLPVGLKSLHLTNFRLGSDEPEKTKFYQFLTETVTLNDLQFLECSHLEKLFKTNLLVNLRCQLKSLRLPVKERFAEVDDNVYKFLHSHSGSLESLFMAKVSVGMIQRIFSEGFILKSFGFLTVVGCVGPLKSANLAMSSLSELQIPIITKEPEQLMETVEPYLKLVPNLKYLQIPQLTKQLLDYLVKHFEHIEEVSYHFNLLDESLNYYNKIHLVEEVFKVE